jgi:hypothetical protein
MKCLAHKTEAVAVCAYCGRALCPDCINSTEAVRMVCSDRCADALAQGEKAMQMMLHHSRQNAKASAFYCYLCAGLSAVAAITAWFMLPSPFLILFTGGCALVLTASGVWYSRVTRQRSCPSGSSGRSSSSGLEELAKFEVARNSAVQGTASSSGSGR